MSDHALPLAALRARLDDGSARSRWLVDPDGVLGRVLELSAGAVFTVPLARLEEPARFRTRAALFPHDWRDSHGALRAVVTRLDADGTRRELWSGVLRAGGRGRPGGASIDCELAAGTTALALEVHPQRDPPYGAVGRAIWVNPELVIPGWSSSDGRSRVPAPARTGGDRTRFSVLVPVHDPPLPMLAEAIESVRAQTHADWELCLSDDGSRDPAVIAALRAAADSDPRIRLHRHDTARGISAATNAALELATGDYIALLDHDDTLAPDALERIADTIAADPALDMVYSDEDIVDAGRQVWVHLKAGWSPDTLRTNGYTCHLGVYRRSLVNEIGGFRSAFDGSQDIDMILRLTERTDRVGHVPQILYHWRAHAASTAGGDAKPYAYVAARRAYAAHLERTGVDGSVGYGPPGLYRLSATVAPTVPVTIVLAAGAVAAEAVAAAARSWVAQPHPAWRVVLAAPPAEHAGIERGLERAGVDAERVTLLAEKAAATSGLAVAAQAAAAAAEGEAGYLLLLQAPAVGLTHDWLSRLLSYGAQPGIGAVGPVLLAPDGRVAHAGVALPAGLALHLLHGERTSMDDHFGFGTSVHNVSALSGALLTPAELFAELGGLDASLRELALVDYCVRAGERGARIVTVPDVRLRLTAPDTTENDLAALRELGARWGRTHLGDPFYPAGYRTDRGDFRRRAA